MLIHLIRHARPEAVEGSCYGRTNLPVRREETVSAARGVRAILPGAALETGAIHCSPLSRCIALACELAPDRTPVIAPELVELDFGAWEGSPWTEVPRGELDAWARDPWGYAPGGGESARSVLRRFERWVSRLQDHGVATVVAVTHAGLIRVALARGCADPAALSQSIPYGSVRSLAIGAARRRTAGPARALP